MTRLFPRHLRGRGAWAQQWNQLHLKLWAQLAGSNADLVDGSLEHQTPSPSKIEGDLANGPLSKLLELLDFQV